MGEESKITHVSKDYLVRLFTDPEFIAHLRECNSIRQVESSFDVLYSFTGSDYRIHPVQKGNKFDDGGVPMYGDSDFYFDGYGLVNVHSHTTNKVIIPSVIAAQGGGDLHHASKFRHLGITAFGIDLKLINGIITLRKRDQPIDLLLYQETTEVPVDEKTLLYMGELLYPDRRRIEQGEVIKRLRETGLYKVEFVQLRGNNWDDEALEKIVSFNFVPEVKNRRKYFEQDF